MGSLLSVCWWLAVAEKIQRLCSNVIILWQKTAAVSSASEVSGIETSLDQPPVLEVRFVALHQAVVIYSSV